MLVTQQEVATWRALPDSVRIEMRNLVASMGTALCATLWRRVSAPANYVTPLDSACRDGAEVFTHLGYPDTVAMNRTRRALTIAGQFHGFCTERVDERELEGEGPHLCGSPLNEGRCPAVEGHRTTVATAERDEHLRRARSALHKAVQAQARTADGDNLGELVVGLEDMTQRVMNVLGTPSYLRD